MKGLFDDILSIEDVEGILLFSPDGHLSYQKFRLSMPVDTNSVDWPVLAKALNGIREADVIFENKRIYFRKTSTGHLMILMGISAPAAMVRLHTDLILPAIREILPSGRLRRFLNRRK